MRQDVRGDAGPAVRDGYPDGRRIGRKGSRDLDRPATGGIPLGIRDEVADHLANPHGIDFQQGHVLADRRPDRNAAFVGGGSEGVDSLGDEHIQVGGLAVQRQCSAFGQGQRAQVVDEPRQHPCLVEDPGQVCLVGWINPVDERLEIALHDSQRRP